MLTATYNGRGEFYSGIRKGERVQVKVDPTWSRSVSIQSIRHPGAWLTVYTTRAPNYGIYVELDDFQEVC